MVMAMLTVQTAAAILCTKTLLLSPLTAMYRFKTGKFIATEDISNKKRKEEGKVSVGSSVEIDRVRHAQRNAMENVFIGVLLFALNSKAAFIQFYGLNILTIFTVSRVMHTNSYLLGLQPWRAIFFMIGMVCNFFMIYKTASDGNDFQKWLALLLLKVQIMSPLTGMMRKVFKAPRGEIAEDLKLTGLDKPPASQNARVERIQNAHMDDLYVVIPFVIVCLFTKQAGVLSTSKIAQIAELFLYARTGYSLIAILGLPEILSFVAYFAGVWFQIQLLLSWNFQKKFDIHRKSHLLVGLAAKVMICGVIQKLYFLVKGRFGPSLEELEHPEKHTETEITRISNLLRNCCENVVCVLCMITVVRFVNIPHQFIYHFAIARTAWTLVYLLHVPQPSRALCWMAGLVYGIRMAMLAF